MAKGLMVDAADNVIVTFEALVRGDELNWRGGSLLVHEAVPVGHKVAACDIGQDEPIIKYGTAIGLASQPIAKGTHVHCHNVKDLSVTIKSK